VVVLVFLILFVDGCVVFLFASCFVSGFYVLETYSLESAILTMPFWRRSETMVRSQVPPKVHSQSLCQALSWACCISWRRAFIPSAAATRCKNPESRPQS